MKNTEWRVRESIIRVRESDTLLQAELEKIGFHILEDGQDSELPNAPEAVGPFVVIGRDELTPFDELGTSIAGIEYCQRYVRLTHEGTDQDSLLQDGGPEETSSGPEGEQRLPAVWQSKSIRNPITEKATDWLVWSSRKQSAVR
jgi:hypothetical protein